MTKFRDTIIKILGEFPSHPIVQEMRAGDYADRIIAATDDAQAKRIAELEEQVKSAEVVCDSYADENQRFHDRIMELERVAKLSKDLLQNAYDLGFAQAIKMAAELANNFGIADEKADYLVAAIAVLKPPQEEK